MYDKIIDIARELFLQRGIRSVTMDEIATEAGISKRTLYEMFANKEDLLSKLTEYIWDEHRDIVKNIIDATPSCLIGILNILKYATEENKHKIEAKSKECFFIDLKKFYPKIVEKNKERRDLYFSFMAQHLKKGVEQQTVRNDLNLDLVSTLFIAQIEGINNIIKSIQQFDSQEIFTTLILSFCRGISTEKGMKEIEDFVIQNKIYAWNDKNLKYFSN
ncbi:MAG: TetR/AcrR family transcriptional regulator [Prevotellaceae bacterium]|jgi:AcrR family transcriptional regulator|nr:TetR/AcrR family transcriptional regulator [Prevotellaceae bacterium]